MAYGVVISNLAVYAVAAVAGWHLVVDGYRNPLNLPVTLFTQSLRQAVASTAALFVDVVGALVVFEAVSRRLRGSLFLQAVADSGGGDGHRQPASSTSGCSADGRACLE